MLDYIIELGKILDDKRVPRQAEGKNHWVIVPQWFEDVVEQYEESMLSRDYTS